MYNRPAATIIRSAGFVFRFDHDTDEWTEHTNGTHERVIQTIYDHRPHRTTCHRLHCRRCRTWWPCTVITVLDETFGLHIATITSTAKPHPPGVTP